MDLPGAFHFEKVLEGGLPAVLQTEEGPEVGLPAAVRVKEDGKSDFGRP
jgi:hypothetical protein